MRSELEAWIDAQLLGYHEAAHAVVAVELGWDVYWTTVGSAADGFAETFASLETNNTTARPGTLAFRRAVERDCLFLLAGWATERVIMRAHTQTSDFGADIERATNVLWLLHNHSRVHEESLSYALKQAMRLVARPEVFIRIRHVTDALLKRRTLSGGDVLRAIAAADLHYGTGGRRPLLAARHIVRPGCPVLHPIAWRVGPPRFPLVPERVPVPIAHPQKKQASTLDEPSRPKNARERQQLFADAFAPVRLSGRALGAMRRGEISKLDDLLGWKESELMRIRGVGEFIVREIATALQEAGLTLWPERESDTTTEKV